MDLEYDANGNLVSVLPPGRPQHELEPNEVDLLQAYYAPTVGLVTPTTHYEYNRDKQLELITRPDGSEVDPVYDATTGQLLEVLFPTGELEYTYDPTVNSDGSKTGHLVAIDTDDGARLDFGYQGPLFTGTTWSGTMSAGGWTGTLSGQVSFGYNNDLRVSSVTVEGTSFAYSYDGDGVLTQAGALQAYAEDDDAARTVTTGRLWKTVLGTVQTVQSYTPYGEVEAFTATTGQPQDPVLSTALEYDDLGRIVEKHETIGSATTDYEYVYDDAGRLWQVKVGGSVVETYTYDDNGNRVSKDPSVGATLVGVTNDWDQLECYAQNTSPCDGLAYTYTLNGELATRTEVGSGDVTSYSYDALGNLREVELPDGTVITYLIDGLNRRVGKVVNGVLEKRWLYLDGLRIAAEIEVASNVTTRFVYGTRGNIPDYMVRSGTTYRIISDHLGSPRLVVNTSTGAVVRRMEYDVFGQVQDDPGSGIEHGGWIPFGFAGGLYDPDTGLVRFGARDYDPETGRWTAKDPIGFAGGDTNLYGYVANDPVNWRDPQVYLLRLDGIY